MLLQVSCVAGRGSGAQYGIICWSVKNPKVLAFGAMIQKGWTPHLCKMMACWALLRGCGSLLYILLGSRESLLLVSTFDIPLAARDAFHKRRSPKQQCPGCPSPHVSSLRPHRLNLVPGTGGERSNQKERWTLSTAPVP